MYNQNHNFSLYLPLSPYISLMRKNNQNHPFSHVFQKIIVQLECATAPYISPMWNLIL